MLIMLTLLDGALMQPQNFNRIISIFINDTLPYVDLNLHTFVLKFEDHSVLKPFLAETNQIFQQSRQQGHLKTLFLLIYTKNMISFRLKVNYHQIHTISLS